MKLFLFIHHKWNLIQMASFEIKFSKEFINFLLILLCVIFFN